MVQKFKKSRLSWHKQEQLIEHFISGSMARCASELVGIHRNSAILYFHHLRKIIAYELDRTSNEMFGGEIEVDESFVAVFVKANGDGVQVAKPLYLACLKGSPHIRQCPSGHCVWTVCVSNG